MIDRRFIIENNVPRNFDIHIFNSSSSNFEYQWIVEIYGQTDTHTHTLIWLYESMWFETIYIENYVG